MINRMIEEKEEIAQQINRTDQLLKQIDLSINAKKETYVNYQLITIKYHDLLIVKRKFSIQ